jgi:SNF family Na+-dependent transporter
MITSIILLIFLVSFVFYSTSKKAQLTSKTIFEDWIQSHRQYSKIISSLLLVTAFILSINNFGITSGIIFWLVILMSLLSLIIIISPLKKVNYKHLVFAFFILLIFEFTL